MAGLSFVDLVIDGAGLEQLRCSPAMVHVCESIAAAGEAGAHNIAQAEAYLTGAYDRGITHTSGVAVLPDVGRTAFGQVAGTDWKSNMIEKGTAKTPAKHVIERAVTTAAGEGFTVQ